MIQLAIAGFGNIGKVHLANLQGMRGCRVAGIFDTRAEALEQAPAGVRRYPDLPAVLADPAIDALLIATPSGSHREIAEAALAAGKHIFVEKPLAGTLSDAEAIVDAAAQTTLCAQAGFCERFNPQYLEAKRAIASGALGAVRSVQSSRIAPLALGDPAWDLGVLDTAVHNLDLILWLTGGVPRRVRAYGATVYPNVAIPASVTTIIEFEDGSLATDHVAWIDDERHPLHQCARSTMRLIGSGGMFEIDLASRPSRLLTPGSYREIDTVIIGSADYYSCLRLQFESFLRSIEQGAPVAAPLKDALLAERVVIAAAESLRAGREMVIA